MKTIMLSAAMIAFSALAANACNYGNTSAKADSKMTVASIEAAKQSLPTTNAPVRKADERPDTRQSKDIDQD